VEFFRAVTPLGPVGSGVSNVWSIKGLSPDASEYTEWPCVDSVLALDGAAPVGGGGTGVSADGAAVETAVAGADAGVSTGDAVGVATGDAVGVGAADGSASAGESGTAVSEARVTTSAAISAVVFRIEFTWCLS